MSGVIRQIIDETRQAAEAAEALAGLPLAAYENLAESRGVDLDDVVCAFLRDGDVGAVVRMRPLHDPPKLAPSRPPTPEARAVVWGSG